MWRNGGEKSRDIHEDRLEEKVEEALEWKSGLVLVEGWRGRS